LILLYSVDGIMVYALAWTAFEGLISK
jgi:hypothetical protein